MDRTAIDTIKGYFYQFDYFLASLLELNHDDETILIEGVEDVDIQKATEETAVQCKYYSKTEYNHSVISEPIRLMLDHFKKSRDNSKPVLNYKLRGYYKSGQNKLTLPLDLQFLKDNFLTYTKLDKTTNKKIKHYHHLELGLDDKALSEFLNLFEIDINAKEFEEQYKEILKALEKKFECSAFTAEYFFYNNALSLVRKLSIEALTKDRKISKKVFLEKINTRKILFSEWFIELKGRNAHFQNLKKEYFSDHNILAKERFFLIEIDNNSYNRSELKNIINRIITNFTKINKQPTPFCPYIYLHGISNVELIEIKKDCIANEILINDGFDFEGSSFNSESILKRPNALNPIKIKFLNSLSYLSQTLALTSRKSEIYQFYQNNSFFDLNNSSIEEIKIQISHLKDIQNII